MQITLTAKELADQRLLQYWNTAAGEWQTATGIHRVTVGGSYDISLADYSLVWKR